MYYRVAIQPKGSIGDITYNSLTTPPFSSYVLTHR